MFESATKSVECRTMTAHFAKDSPKPAKAPVRPATVWQKHKSSTNPTQLKTKAAGNNKLQSNYMPLLHLYDVITYDKKNTEFSYHYPAWENNFWSERLF